MKKKLGINQIEVNKKFKNKYEAFQYAKRLRERVRYVCKTKADKGWQAQAMIIVSNVKGNVAYQYYEHSGQVGRPKKKKGYSKIIEQYYNGNSNTDWHIHVLLVSKPSYAFRDDIKKYIDKNWFQIPILHKEVDFKDLKKKVYKKNTNINIAEYFIDQSEDILFCNYNYTDEQIIPKGYTLKDLYKAYMKSRTSSRYSGKYIDNWEKKIWIDESYYKIKNFYYNLTKEKMLKEQKDYIKQCQYQRICENYNKVQNIHCEIKEENSYY